MVKLGSEKGLQMMCPLARPRYTRLDTAPSTSMRLCVHPHLSTSVLGTDARLPD